MRLPDNNIRKKLLKIQFFAPKSSRIVSWLGRFVIVLSQRRRSLTGDVSGAGIVCDSYSTAARERIQEEVCVLPAVSSMLDDDAMPLFETTCFRCPCKRGNEV